MLIRMNLSCLNAIVCVSGTQSPLALKNGIEDLAQWQSTCLASARPWVHSSALGGWGVASYRVSSLHCWHGAHRKPLSFTSVPGISEGMSLLNYAP